MIFGSTSAGVCLDLGLLGQFLKPGATNLGLKMYHRLILYNQNKHVVKLGFFRLGHIFPICSPCCQSRLGYNTMNQR